MESESEVAQSCPSLCTPWAAAHQAPLSMGFSRQEYWGGLPCPPSGDLPDSGVEPMSSALAGRFFTTLTNFKVRSKNWVKTMPFWKIQLKSINLNFLVLPMCVIPASSYLLNESDKSFNGPRFLIATVLGWVAVLIHPSTDCLSTLAFNLPPLMSPSLYLL